MKERKYRYCFGGEGRDSKHNNPFRLKNGKCRVLGCKSNDIRTCTIAEVEDLRDRLSIPTGD